MFKAQSKEKSIREQIIEHMHRPVTKLCVVSARFEAYHHANLHLAIEDYATGRAKRRRVVGLGGCLDSLAEILQPVAPGRFGREVMEGPVEYLEMPTGPTTFVSCIKEGMYFLKTERRLVIHLREDGSRISIPGVSLDVVAETRELAEEFIKEMRDAISLRNIFKSRVLSIDPDQRSGIKFHQMPTLARDQIILPDGLLTRIERQTVQAGKYSDALKRAGRKLKRGILLHGKPGTGKTMTAMYLASEMKERTVLLMTGSGMGLLAEYCEAARWLQPSMLIIEDVDLIAEERSRSGTGGLLFELLNMMDGLKDDSDVLFVMTTNRPEILEPALASRPGRVDQAYEIPMPDDESRRKLFELYSHGLTLNVRDINAYVGRTSGASGAFIAELLRKAALFAAPDGEPIEVNDGHLEEALHEMIVAGGSLTKALLGSRDVGFSAAAISGDGR